MRRNRFIAALALAVLIALLPGATAAGATVAWTVTPLTVNDIDDDYPQISGERVVWHGSDGNDNEIYTWTPSGGTSNISNHDGLNDQWPEVSGDRIAWQGWDGNDYEIYTWTPGGGTSNISNHDARDDVGALVSGDRVVWSGDDGNDYEVYTWTPGGGTSNISNHDGLDDRQPRVSGDRVVWEVNDGDYEIYTWTPGGGTSNISNHDGLDDRIPQVSGDRVSWDGWDGNDWEIYTWTPAGGPTNISNHDGLDDEYSQVSGDRVVWQGFKGSYREIYTWTPGGGTSNISNHDTLDDFNAQVSGDRVVWEDWDLDHYDVYTWTPAGGTSNVSSHGGNEDGRPQVSGDRVVWLGWDGNDWEVYTAVPAGLTVVGIAGPNRYATSVEVSKKAFPTGAEAVVIATGENWPDALGGSSLAGALDGPILLTKKTALPSEVAAEIGRLGAKKAVILGSTAAVSSAVAGAVDALPGVSVERIGGANRYDTARMIAARAVSELGGAYDHTAFVATGGNFPDALGASPLAAKRGWPIFLVNPATGADAATIAAMKAAGVTKAIVLGDARAVSEKSKNAITSGVPCTTERLAGANRYDTAVAVASFGVANAGLGWDRLALATGTNFPDALSGGVLQGRSSSVLLLTPGTSLNATVASTLTINKATIHEVRFLGDTKAISAGVRAAVENALK